MMTREEIKNELGWTESDACFFIAKCIKDGRLKRVKRGMYEEESAMKYIQEIKERRAIMGKSA